MNKTDIEWTTFSANPLKYRRKADGKVVWGCVKTSPGCAHCYAEAVALRFERGKLFNAKNMEELEPFLDEAELRKMLTARTIGGIAVDGSRCFVGDMTDLFGAWVPDKLLDRLFAVFALRPSVTWQVLTKRAERVRRFFCEPVDASGDPRMAAIEYAGFALGYDRPIGWLDDDRPLPNVWLGTSVEDQARADERIPHLLATPAAVRFLSCEPLLGPVDLTEHLYAAESTLTRPMTQLQWVIVGGESGPGARRFELDWARSIQKQCDAAEVPLFFKQAGSNPHDWTRGDPPNHVPPELVPLHLRTRKGGDPSEWPADLRVREFPEATRA